MSDDFFCNNNHDILEIKYKLTNICEKRRKIIKKTPHILDEFNNYSEIFSLSGALGISR